MVRRFATRPPDLVCSWGRHILTLAKLKSVSVTLAWGTHSEDDGALLFPVGVSVMSPLQCAVARGRHLTQLQGISCQRS